MTWTDEDFRDVFGFLANIRDLLRDCPDKIAEYRDILLTDCQTAKDAFTRIFDAIHS